MAEYLTAALPGIGGRIRDEAADFRVDEIPLYEPCGSGEHLYLDIEKQGLTTFELLNRLAAALDCRERDLGYAGLKDARAVTRQTVSVPLRSPEDVAGLELPGVRILGARLHTNKLRPGHLAGNRFRIRISEPQPAARDRAEAILGVLTDLGVPNRFGAQRYGLLANSHRVGSAILGGDFASAASEIVGDPDRIEHPGWRQAAVAFRAGELATAISRFPRHCRHERRLVEQLKAGQSHERAVMGMPRKLLRLYLSAYQASLFDRLVAMRLASIERVWPGDLAWKHANGACFLVTDAETEQRRADRFEISASGPLFGCKVRLAESQAGLLEHSLLESEGLDLEAFRLGRGLTMEGERRPLRVPLQEARVENDGTDLVVAFRLPKGSYATTVLAELMKTESGPVLADDLH